MFFYLSKIIWSLISPLNLIFLIFVFGAVVLPFFRALGRSALILGFFLFFVCGVFPTGKLLLSGLEEQYEKPARMPETIAGILVLGGSFETNISATRGAPAINDAAERIIEAAGLAQRYPQSILTFSGGNNHIFNNQHTEARNMELFLETLGLSLDNFVYEDESRNTYENIFFSRDLILPQAGENWILITSAYHMPRAMAVARAAGWPVIPYPVDYRTPANVGWLPQRFDMLGNFYDLQVAFHELVGLVAYQLTGKISLTVK